MQYACNTSAGNTPSTMLPQTTKLGLKSTYLPTKPVFCCYAATSLPMQPCLEERSAVSENAVSHVKCHFHRRTNLCCVASDGWRMAGDLTERKRNPITASGLATLAQSRGHRKARPLLSLLFHHVICRLR